MLFASVTTRRGGWTVLSVTGDCDLASAPQLRRELLRAGEDVERLAVDLRGVSFLDSVSLGLLVGAARRVEDLVVVAGTEDPARRALSASRVDQILRVLDDLPVD